MTHFNDSFARSRITYFFACDVATSIISRNRVAGANIAVRARDCNNKIPTKCIGLPCSLAKSKCITNCVRDLRRDLWHAWRKYSAEISRSDAIPRYRSPSSRGRRILSEHRVYDARLIKATTLSPSPSSPNPASTPAFTPKNGGAVPRSGQESPS